MSQASSSGTTSNCQQCNQDSHLSQDCPYMNTPCTIPGCPGQRMILVSKTEKNTARKFLKCQQSQCNGFQWLDHAILASHGYQVPVQGCFICNDPAHWMKDCPWNSLVCGKNGCTAKKWLRISSNPKSAGKRYLKCYTCKAFEWVKEEDDDDDLQQPFKKPSPLQKLVPLQQSAPVKPSKTPSQQPAHPQQPTPSQHVPTSGYAARVVNETLMDGLCLKFETYISFKKNETDM